MQSLYPPSPAAVPADLTRPTSAYKTHAWVAMAALAAFALFYLGVAAWFCLVAYRSFSAVAAAGDKPLLHLGVGIGAAFLAVFMLKAVFFIRRGNPGQDTEIKPAEQPALFDFLYKLADEAGAPRPHKVFLSASVNAAVFYDLSILNFLLPSRKNLVIGLPLINVLTLAEFKAVLAHEFGHFAQRSMAVGRWVYIAQQVAGQVVARRDAMDGFLEGLSRVDIRVAWIGWAMRLVLWSIRSLLDLAFRGVVLAQRALSREMELQADLVSVSLTGSDALVHALHRLPAAEDGWERAVSFLFGQYSQGKQLADVFAVQSRIIEHHRMILADPQYDRPPAIPANDPAQHRVFRADFAQRPAMWSTHPLNHERELNAKRVYVPTQLDARPAWVLFENAQALRQRETGLLLKANTAAAGETAPVAVPLEESLKTLDVQFNRECYNRGYRGAYLGRSVALHTEKFSDLYVPAGDDALKSLASLYPESLTADFEKLRDLGKELALLQGLRTGSFTAAGDGLLHRGKRIKRRQLPAAIKVVEGELQALEDKLAAHDKRVRSVHKALAARLAGDARIAVQSHLEAMLQLIHYADHQQANLQDARRFWNNTVSVVTATGKTNKAGVKRAVAAAAALYAALSHVYENAAQVRFGAALAEHMRAESWQATLGEFKLAPPHADNINDWMRIVGSWVEAASDTLAHLRSGALQSLLLTEKALADMASAPEPVDPARNGVIAAIVTAGATALPVTPADFPLMTPQHARKLQEKLGFLARFHLADGLLPSVLKLAAAGSIVGPILFFGGSIGQTSIVIHNGLGTPVQIALGGKSVSVPAFGNTTAEIEPAGQLSINAKNARGQTIESFTADASSLGGKYIYNVGGGSPLIEWTAAYGTQNTAAPRKQGALRWQQSSVDYLFTAPPESISGRRNDGGTTRQVLEGFGARDPNYALGLLPDAAARAKLAGVHARWDDPDSRYAILWMYAAAQSGDFKSILAARLRERPDDVAALRVEQDSASEAERAQVCARDRAQAAAAPQNANLQYIAARCIDAREEREATFAQAYARWPDHPWLQFVAAFRVAEQSRWAEAAKLWDSALRRAPVLMPLAAVESARARRMAAGEQPANINDLAEGSEELRFLADTESGKNWTDSPILAYSQLAQGKLPDALKTIARAPDLEKRFLRLAAVSDAADKALEARAAMLDPAAGIDPETVWAAVALAIRTGADPAPHFDFARKASGPEGARLIGIAQLLQSGASVASIDAAINQLGPHERGHALSMAIAVLRDKAPEQWRRDVKRLLFAYERPYFQIY